MRHFSRLLQGCVALAMLCLVAQVAQAPALAQATRPPVIVVIDMQKILRESSAVQSLQRAIDLQRSAYQSELRKKEEALRDADQELARQQTILSAEAFAKKRKELEQQVAALQREIQERKKGIETVFGQGMNQVRDALIDIAQALASERGADLVLAKTTVVLVKPELDLTDEALKRLNAALPSVALGAPQN